MRKLPLCLLLLVLFVTFAAPVFAQETDPIAPNRANIYLFVEYFRNRNMTDLLPAINSADYMAYTPFSPDGAPSNPTDAIPGENDMNAAFDLDFTGYIILADGNYVGLIGYQEADFTGEIFDTPPNGQHYGDHILFATEFDETGMALSDIEVFNPINFYQFMGWAPADYAFASQPWDVRLGTTSTTPAQHHATLQSLWDALSSGGSAANANAYAAGVVTHDYLADRSGAEATVAMYDALAGLDGFSLVDTRIICEGDLCLTGVVTSVTATDPADEDGHVNILWMAVHRFVDGQIVEEWWNYDNAALWAFLPPET
ncbi:MAG: nuclear transport factor 2 family protein [Anaerolineae bacterium]|nr:nuclear transport factor 2 family protein [Anaerolineae bacterium]